MKKQVLILVTLLLPLVASAYDLVDDKGLFYNLKDDGTLEVVGLDTETTTADILSDVTIGGVEYRVTSIGERAFEGRSDITYLSIPWSVTSIGEYAFIDCGSSITVNIADPESWCEMELGNEHSSPLSSAGKVLVHDIETTSINIPEGVTSIGNFTFYQCRCITSLIIPSSVKSIGSSAFEDCSDLVSLNLSDGLESIGGSAFEGCAGLKILRIPSTVNTISINAFANCTGITDVYCYAENVPMTDENAFDGTPTENSILHVPNNAVNAYSEAWPWSDFKKKVPIVTRTIHVATAGTLPNLISDDEKYQIDELTLTGELNGTDFYFIRQMAGLDYETWGRSGHGCGVDYISTNGILSSLDISQVTIVKGGRAYLTTDDYFSMNNSKYYQTRANDVLNDDSFHEQSKTRTITDNELYGHYTKDNNISYLLFYRTNLESIVLPNNITTIEQGAFFCNILTSIVIPQSVSYIAERAFNGCKCLVTIRVESSNTMYDNRNNCNAIIEKSSNTLIAGCKTTIIPNSVNSIGNYAFYNCSSLTSVTIPNSVTSIGNYAFSGCNGLTSVTIPNSVTSIGNYAFMNCNGLTSVTIPNSVTSIGNAFNGCSSLTSVTIPNSVTSIDGTAFNGTGWYNNQSNGFLYLENWLLGYKGNKPTGDMTIIEGTKGIASSAFYSCSGLTSVTIPNSVSSIGDNAFWYCSGLTSIYSLSRMPSSCGSKTFSYVDKTNCVVWVPKGCLAAYKNADVWKDFTNIRELSLGDVNIDLEVNKEDLNATTSHIMGKDPEGFYESLADLNGDEVVNAADVVKIVDILNVQNGLSNDWQLSFNSNQVVSSLACTLNNNGDKAIQLTKCELYYNQNLVGYATFNVTLASGGSKKCSFEDLANYAAKTGFYVIWHYTYNGEEYTYRCDLTK